MLKPIAFANAVAAVSLVLYVVCRVISLIAPDFLFAIGSSWLHTFSIDSMRATVSLDLGTFVLGAVSLGVLAWVTAFGVAYLYNQWAK